jgi:hypothetical protein
MVNAPHCPHCDFAVPRAATRCPGCRRRLPGREVLAVAAPHLTAADGSHPYRSLAEPARVARALLDTAGLAACAVAGTFFARLAMAVEPLGDEVAGRSLAGVAEASRAAVVFCLVLGGIAAVAFGLWGAAAHRNLPSLRIVAHRFWADRRDGAHRTLALWLAVPAAAVVVDVAASGTLAGADPRVHHAVAALAGLVLSVAACAARDVVGITTVAHARRAEALARDRVPDERIDVAAAIAR